jgi:hypothetical protein
MVIEGVGQLVVVDEHNEVIGSVTLLDIARQVATRAGYLAHRRARSRALHAVAIPGGGGGAAKTA